MKTSNAYVLLFLLFQIVGKTFAEGTKTISPTSSYCTALNVMPSAGDGSFFGCPADNKVHFYIKDYTSEKLYYGFQWRDYSPDNPYTLSRVVMRIYNPDGTTYTDLNLTNSGAGYIQNYIQGYNGPRISGTNTNYYNPGVYTPLVNGEYTVVFKRQYNSWGVWYDSASDSHFYSPYFDMTVAKNSATIYDGRVYCNKWSLVAIDPTAYTNVITASAEPVVYPYTPDGVVYKVDFEAGFEPIAFTLGMNDYGVVNGGNWANDRKSASQAGVPALTNCYKVFLNTPDASVFPTASALAAPVFASPAIIGKWPGPYTVRFKLQEAGDCQFLIDRNGNGSYDVGTTDRLIEVPSCIVGVNTFAWDGKDGLGAVVPKGTSVTIIISTRKGRTNLPLIDAEINRNGINVATIAPVTVAKNRLYWDDSALTTETNNSTTGGIDNSLYGTQAPAHAWSGNGNPTQVIPAPAVGSNETDDNPVTDFGNVRVINTWFWGVMTSASSARLISDVSISGTVWNDIDNSAAGTFANIKTGTEAGTSGGGLYAILVDPELGIVLSSTAVNSDGTYTLTGCPAYGNSMPVILSTTPGTIDAVAPTAGVFSTWTSTTLVSRTLTTTTTDITGIDFGVQQRPTATGSTNTITPIPTGTNTTTVLASWFSGTDYSGGTIASLKITAFPTNASSITINGTSYTPGTFPGGGVTVPTNAAGQPSQSISVDPAGDVAVTVTIPFTVTDNSGAQSTNTANVVLNYVPQADVQITKNSDTATPNVGSNVTFTLVARNNGTNGATGVSVADNTPSGYTLVSGTPTVGSWTSPTWAIGALASGASATLTLVYSVTGTGSYANTATITRSETDPVSSNNVATSTPVPAPFDFGDAPNTYITTLSVDGARSNINANLKIGTTVDGEADAVPNAAANGDGADEDGVSTIPSQIRTGTSYSLSVSVFNNTGSAKTLQGWIDFNRNNVFDDSEYATVAVPANASQQTVSLTWAGLSGGVSGTSYIRLRLNDNATKAATDDIGAKGTGEVEDYTLCILPASPASGGDKAECVASPVQTLTATATVSGGETLVWYNAATGGSVLASPTLNSVGTVTYYAQANANTGGCSSATRTPVRLTIYPTPMASATKTDVSCFNAGNGSITITVSVGTSPYTFSINNGATYPYSGTSPYTINNLVSGTYKVRVKDTYGCESVVNP